MISEAELLDTFNADLDGTAHSCLIELFAGADGYARALTDDLVAEGKTVERHCVAPIVLRSYLTINEMQTLAGRWSCIRSIEPNRVITQ